MSNDHGGVRSTVELDDLGGRSNPNSSMAVSVLTLKSMQTLAVAWRHTLLHCFDSKI